MRNLIYLLMIGMVMFLIACNNESTIETGDEEVELGADSSDSVVIGVTNAPKTLNPFDFDNNTDRITTSLLFSPLVDLDQDYEWVPNLADSIETEDYKTYIVKLNENATWTDGEPITVEDLIYTIQLIGNPDITFSYSNIFSAIEGFNDEGKLDNIEEISGINKIDEYTLEINLKNEMDPNAFNDSFGKNIKTLPKHVMETIEPSNFDMDEFFRKPNVTSGPYKFVEHSNDQYLELEANQDYFKGLPNISKLFFKVLNAANISSQLASGEIDMNYPGVGNIPIEDYEQVENSSNLQIFDGNTSSTQVLTFNLEVIDDIKIREAIIHAIDRETITKNLYSGGASVMDGTYPPGHLYHYDDIVPREYDPEKAKQLVEESNWDNSEPITFVAPSGNVARERTGSMIVENLRTVGINAEIELNDISSVIQRYTDKDFDIVLFGFTFEFDPDEEAYLKTGAHLNASGYSNEQMDDLLDKGLQEPKPEVRHDIYREVQELLLNDLPMTGIYAELPISAANKRIKGVTPVDPGLLSNVHEWVIEE